MQCDFFQNGSALCEAFVWWSHDRSGDDAEQKTVWGRSAKQSFEKRKLSYGTTTHKIEVQWSLLFLKVYIDLSSLLPKKEQTPIKISFIIVSGKVVIMYCTEEPLDTFIIWNQKQLEVFHTFLYVQPCGMKQKQKWLNC